jgi:molybdopterin-guanine dinucleotide biosynthesis protein A
VTVTLGVLVAGGSGRRLGRGVPKALVQVAGRTLLERALAVLAEVCDEVIVVAPATFPLPVVLPVQGALRVADVPGAAGPLAGVAAGLAARGFECALVLGVDFPLMRPAALAVLRDRIGGAPALLPAPGGVPQPLAAAYRPEAAPALAAALERGERSLTAAVLALAPRVLADTDLERIEGGLGNFFNLNTPEDLAEAEVRLGLAPGAAPGALARVVGRAPV